MRSRIITILTVCSLAAVNAYLFQDDQDDDLDMFFERAIEYDENSAFGLGVRDLGPFVLEDLLDYPEIMARGQLPKSIIENRAKLVKNDKEIQLWAWTFVSEESRPRAAALPHLLGMIHARRLLLGFSEKSYALNLEHIDAQFGTQRHPFFGVHYNIDTHRLCSDYRGEKSYDSSVLSRYKEFDYRQSCIREIFGDNVAKIKSQEEWDKFGGDEKLVVVD